MPVKVEVPLQVHIDGNISRLKTGGKFMADLPIPEFYLNMVVNAKQRKFTGVFQDIPTTPEDITIGGAIKNPQVVKELFPETAWFDSAGAYGTAVIGREHKTSKNTSDPTERKVTATLSDAGKKVYNGVSYNCQKVAFVLNISFGLTGSANVKVPEQVKAIGGKSLGTGFALNASGTATVSWTMCAKCAKQ